MLDSLIIFIIFLKKIEKELDKKEYLYFFYNMIVFRIYNKHIKGSKNLLILLRVLLVI